LFWLFFAFSLVIFIFYLFHCGVFGREPFLKREYENIKREELIPSLRNVKMVFIPFGIMQVISLCCVYILISKWRSVPDEDYYYLYGETITWISQPTMDVSNDLSTYIDNTNGDILTFIYMYDICQQPQKYGIECLYTNQLPARSTVLLSFQIINTLVAVFGLCLAFYISYHELAQLIEVYRCQHCTEYFESQEEVLDHVNKTHHENVLECEECLLNYKLKDHETHAGLCDKKKRLLCKLCGLRSIDIDTFFFKNVHMQKHGDFCDKVERTTCSSCLFQIPIAHFSSHEEVCTGKTREDFGAFDDASLYDNNGTPLRIFCSNSVPYSIGTKGSLSAGRSENSDIEPLTHHGIQLTQV